MGLTETSLNAARLINEWRDSSRVIGDLLLGCPRVTQVVFRIWSL